MFRSTSASRDRETFSFHRCIFVFASMKFEPISICDGATKNEKKCDKMNFEIELCMNIKFKRMKEKNTKYENNEGKKWITSIQICISMYGRMSWTFNQLQRIFFFRFISRLQCIAKRIKHGYENINKGIRICLLYCLYGACSSSVFYFFFGSILLFVCE